MEVLGNRKQRHRAWRYVLRAATAAVLTGALVVQGPHAHAQTRTSQPTTCGASWVAAWHASPVQYTSKLTGPLPMNPRAEDSNLRPLSGRTIRMIVHPEASGSAMRVHLTNRYGTRPLRIGNVTVAERDDGASIVRATLRDVSFAGRRGVTIAPGASAVSEPVAMPVVAGRALAVSLYLLEAVDPVTRHVDTRTTSYVSGTEDYSQTVPAWPFTVPTMSAFYMDGVDVLSNVRLNAVMAVGDSITDGNGTTADARSRWTDVLQQRLDAAEPGREMVVLNGAIGANRLLTDTVFHHGESAISRLSWDIATNAGVTDVILHEGTNDIGLRSARNAKAIIAGMKEFAAEARSLGLRVFVTTITPSTASGFGDRRFGQIREAVNTWIRRSGEGTFDGVFDFAGAVANPSRRSALASLYDAGDKLHIGDAGQERLASAIDINALSGSPCMTSP